MTERRCKLQTHKKVLERHCSVAVQWYLEERACYSISPPVLFFFRNTSYFFEISPAQNKKLTRFELDNTVLLLLFPLKPTEQSFRSRRSRRSRRRRGCGQGFTLWGRCRCIPLKQQQTHNKLKWLYANTSAQWTHHIV